MNTDTFTAGGAPRSQVSSIVHRVRFEARNILAVSPRLYLPVARMRHARDEDAAAVTRDTEIVLEGFQRCANTFAYFAFALAQPRPVKIAHHIHAPAQLIAAARWGIAAVLLIREPGDAITSMLMRRPDISPAQALRQYARFHETVTPVRSHLVVARFEAVTSDFGHIVAVVNDRFGTTFTPFRHTRENEQHCFEMIEERHLRLTRGSAIRQTMIAKPSEERASLKSDVLAILSDAKLDALRGRAASSYERLSADADL